MPGPNPIRSNIQEQIYEILKEDIVNGKLEPGKQMKELELVDRFQVSRSPIREALRRLGADDELLDTIDGYMDFDQLGRDMMEEDRVRQTGYGLIRRLSKPFPEPETGIQMM